MIQQKFSVQARKVLATTTTLRMSDLQRLVHNRGFDKQALVDGLLGELLGMRSKLFMLHPK